MAMGVGGRVRGVGRESIGFVRDRRSLPADRARVNAELTTDVKIETATGNA